LHKTPGHCFAPQAFAPPITRRLMCIKRSCSFCAAHGFGSPDKPVAGGAPQAATDPFCRAYSYSVQAETRVPQWPFPNSTHLLERP
jgi:hypothetical protein